MSSKVFKFSIIGAGNIASGYDNPLEKNILTHAHAITKVENAKLLGFFDIDFNKANLAAKKWGCKAYKNINDLFIDLPEAIIICVPNAFHYEILDLIINSKFIPKLVICEKPLTDDYLLSLRIKKKYEEKNIPLWINYQRRLDTNFQILADKYHTGQLGSFLTGSLIYTKGLKHNGSHGLDLILFILGKPKKSIVVDKKYDFFENDPTLSANLFFDDGTFHLQAADEKYYSIFEIDLLFQNIRYKFFYSASKVSIEEPLSDPNFENYKELFNTSTRDTEFFVCMIKIIQEAVRFLNCEIKDSFCNSLSAIETQKLCENLSAQTINKIYEY